MTSSCRTSSGYVCVVRGLLQFKTNFTIILEHSAVQSINRREIMADIESATETYPHFATQAIHAGQDPDQWKSKAVVPPISLSTTFKQDTPGQPVSKRERESVDYSIVSMTL